MNVKETLDALVSYPTNISIVLVGNHGIGKSQVVRQAAKLIAEQTKEPCPCVDFRLSQNDVGDLKGMPFHVNGRTVFAPPEYMPLTMEDCEDLKKLLNLTGDIGMGRYGDNGILFLDEINRATREVQQAAFELVLDRRMNLRPLPSGWRVVSAINGNDDVYTVNAMEMAFRSRFFKIDFNPTIDEWLLWANTNGKVHPSIIEFIRRHGDLLDPSATLLEEASAKGCDKVHDRRAWDLFSQTITKLEKDHKDGNRAKPPLAKDAEGIGTLHLMADGYVGNLAGVKFCSFIETDYEALDGNRILNEWCDEIKDRLVAVVKTGRTPEIAAYNESIMDWIEKNVPKDGKLTKKQKNNLCNYMELLDKELVSSFWSKFNKDNKAISEDWYDDGQRPGDIILQSISAPTKKK